MRRVALALLCVAGSACGGIDDRQIASALQQASAKTPRWVSRDALGRRLWAIERRFYAERQHAPAWIDGDDPTPQLEALLGALRDAERHGLDPAAYGYDELAAARAKAGEAWIGASFDLAVIPELDLRLTYAFLTHAADLLGWRSSPRRVDPNWLPAPKKTDLAQQLRAAIENGAVDDAFAALAPAHEQYTALQDALERLRRSGGADRDIERIRLNLERWRWAPRELGERHIIVNVPKYEMQVVERGTPVLSMRVIVGAPDTPTPLFSDRMTYVVFSPYWNIPESILREETLPRLAEDPEFIARNNIEIVAASGEVVDPYAVDWADQDLTKSFRFRQAPGPDNALGLVKFIFPNNFSVYLHDTPAESLFQREKRTLSHGCVRVERPIALAEYVLQNKAQWTPERIRAAMDGTREQTVRLKEPIPVHIGYWTAWAEADGFVTFLDDPYGLDRKHAAASARARGRVQRPKAPGVRATD